MREDEIGERWPEIPEWADPRELDPEVRRDLRGLSKEGAEFVAGHLFMAGMLADEDPALAWRHARAARSKGGRIGVVRETVGLVAYRAGEWAEAIAELRAARRMSGGPGQLPVLADCERALGHPEKAIELSRSSEAADLDPSSAAEMTIVVAGARADMGQLDAALATVESAVRATDAEPYAARLFYAYADLLLQAARRDEAIEYFMKAADLDVEEETDAGERLTELADEEAELSGTEATGFTADGDLSDGDLLDGDLSDGDLSDGDLSDGEDLSEGDQPGDEDLLHADQNVELIGVDQLTDGHAQRVDIDEPGSSQGGFRSDAAEQDKLLMTADDDDEFSAHPDAPSDAAGRSNATGSSIEAGLTSAQADLLDHDDNRAQASTEVPAASESPDVAGPAQPPTNPGTTGSLFSHHEGGL